MHGLFLFFIALQGFIIPARDEPLERIQWITVDKLEQAILVEPRPVFIYLHTSWCGWCRKMERSTFKNAKLIQYVNENYHAVSFNAEFTQPVIYHGKTYRYLASERVHELTLYLTRGETAFPAMVFLYNMQSAPSPLAGYLTARQLEPVLKYFKEQPGETFESYLKKCKAVW